MNEDFVSYEQAITLNKAGFDWYGDYCYCTEMFCSGNNPIYFDTYSPGERCRWHEVYFIDENGEEDERGIPCPSLAQVAKWLREVKGFHCQVLLNGVRSAYFWQVRERVGNGKFADSTRQYDIFEDAMRDCIDAALKLI